MRTLLLLLAFTSAAFAGDVVKDVPMGELRTQLFALARPVVEKTAGRTVKFQGDMKQAGDWAFFRGQLVDADGKPIRIGEAESSDAVALWRKKDGAWKLVRAEAGFTDVIYLDWATQYGAPAALIQ